MKKGHYVVGFGPLPFPFFLLLPNFLLLPPPPLLDAHTQAYINKMCVVVWRGGGLQAYFCLIILQKYYGVSLSLQSQAHTHTLSPPLSLSLPISPSHYPCLSFSPSLSPLSLSLSLSSSFCFHLFSYFFLPSLSQSLSIYRSLSSSIIHIFTINRKRALALIKKRPTEILGHQQTFTDKTKRKK